MTSGCLPPGFAFTQTALRAYLRCPYHFRLRYIEEVPWPTLAPDPGVEAALERGRRFHELARQHFLGLDVRRLAGAAGEDVARWWEMLQVGVPDLTGYVQRFPEAGLSVPLGGFRLAARYDLLAVGQGKALIVDWKTGEHLPPAEALASDIQTRVYLYVLAAGGAAYHGGRPFSPEALAILYWHPHGPQQVRLSYSASRQAEDGAYLEALIREIVCVRPDSMRPAVTAEPCSSCAYAPLCGRPGGAVEWEMEEEPASESESWLWE